ncbi:hypothetical protein BBJ28_00022811 [Nothophytophthora sp. Chile5]|nr:hypothetical protein BBJ28_00022811 [Nothophytophthora sp. Chile5]
MHDAEASYEDKEWEVIMLIDRYGQPPDDMYLNVMLLPGLYVVNAQDINKVSHCFALQKFRDGSPRKIYADRDAGHELEAFSAKLLSTQKWIDKVRFIREVQRVSKGTRKKRKSKSKNASGSK